MATSLNASLNVQLNAQSLTQASKQVQQALGRITGKASEFQKSLDASTARVFAFGATTAVLNGVTQSFKKLVSTTVEVEKRLIEINSIFQATTTEFNKFRNAIFRVAQETGQSFNTVAEGAAELARQGLSAAETAERLKASLVLTRISGLDAEKSVKALTAAINGFTSAGLTANQIVNKMVAVDTAFAVSAQDLAEAFSRAGSTAEDAGVSFDQLLGLVTAVEQKTARGGAVIGNAFKSIFTRLARGNTIGQLKELGVEIDASMTGVQKLQALSNALENISDPTITSKIKELAGGVFQINVVSAALKDLGSETSIFKNAAVIAAQATNEAFEKNAALSKSISSQINVLIVGLTSLGEKVGKLTFGPLLENLIGIATKFTEFLDKALDPEKGNAFVKGIFKAIGSFLGGPAIVLFTAAFLKIAKLIARFAADGLKSLFAVGSQTERIKQIEGGIVGLLQRDSALRKLITNTSATQLQKEQAIIQAIQRENSLLAQQASLMRTLASAAAARGVRGVDSTGGFLGKKGRRFNAGFRAEEAEAMMRGAPQGVKARYSSGTIGGSKFIMNNKETEIPNFGRNGDSAVIPHYAGGFVPNYARFFRLGGKGEAFSAAAMGRKNLTAKEKAKYIDDEGKGYKKGGVVRKKGLGFPWYNADAPDSQKALMLVPQKQTFLEGALDTEFKEKRRLSTRFKGFKGSVAGIDPNLKQDSAFRRLLRLDQILDAALARGVNLALGSATAKSGGKLKMKPKKFTVSQVKSRMKEGGAGAFGAIRGAVFEAIIDAVTGGIKDDKDSTLDVNIGNNAVVEEIFGIMGRGYKWGDFKNSQGQKDKFIKQTMNNLPRAGAPVGKAGGFIPNYNARRGYGVPASKIRIHRDSMGEPLAVTNTRDEPRGLRDAIGREKKGIGMHAGGFVPNYVEDILVKDSSGKWVPMGKESQIKSSSTSSDDGGKTRGGGGGGTALMMGLMGLTTVLGTVTAKKQQEISLMENASAERIQSIKNMQLGWKERQKLIKAEQEAVNKKKQEVGVMDMLAEAATTAATALMTISTINMLTGGGLGKAGRFAMGFGKAGRAAWGASGKAFGAARAGGAGRFAAGKSAFFGRGAKGSGMLGKGRSMGVGTKLMGKLGVIGAVGGGVFNHFSIAKDKSLHETQKKERQKKNAVVTGMAATGAAIGTLIPIPILGTLIGGALGWAAGKVATGGFGDQGESDADRNVRLATETSQRIASKEGLIGFSEGGFESAVNKNLEAMAKAGQDTEGVEKEYEDALKARADAIKEQALAGEETEEENEARQAELKKAEARRVVASMRLSGQRFADAELRQKNADDLMAAKNTLDAAEKKLAKATKDLAQNRIDMVARAKKKEDQAALQVGLADTIRGPMAGAVKLASQQHLDLSKVETKRAEFTAANDALLQAEKHAEGMAAGSDAKAAKEKEIVELREAQKAAGKAFRDQVTSAGINFKNTIKKTEDLLKDNRKQQIAEARSSMATTADFINKILRGEQKGDLSVADRQLGKLTALGEEQKRTRGRRARWGGSGEQTDQEVRIMEEQYQTYMDAMRQVGYNTKEANRMFEMSNKELHDQIQKQQERRNLLAQSGYGKNITKEGVTAINRERGMGKTKVQQDLITAESKLTTELNLTRVNYENLRKAAPRTVKNIDATQKAMEAAAQSLGTINTFVKSMSEKTGETANAIKENQSVVAKMREVVKDSAIKVEETRKIVNTLLSDTDIQKYLKDMQ